MSDAHRHVGDPDFVPAPEGLYGKPYARERIGLIDEKRAFQDMPPWGDPERMAAVADDSPTSFVAPISTGAAQGRPGSDEADHAANYGDTSSLNVMDGEGNVFSLTESDGHTSTPMIPGWGFGLGGRMYQFNLDPELANVMAPGKRPRNTNSPLLVMKDGQPFMGLSTPGGDQQLQSLLQVFLNVVMWGMSPEQALDQPRFGSYNFPGTGSEVNNNPAVLNLEDRIPAETARGVTRHGPRRALVGPVELARVRSHGDLARSGNRGDDRGGGREAGDCVARILNGRHSRPALVKARCDFRNPDPPKGNPPAGVICESVVAIVAKVTLQSLQSICSAPREGERQ